MIPDFKTFISESIWSDIQDRSSGDTVRKEDDVNLLDRDEFYDYLKNKYNKISHLIYEDQSEIHITLGWSYFPRRDYKIDIHWVEKNKIKNLYLNFGPCELDTLCNKKFKTGTANDDISNEEILNIIDFCLDYISSHKEIESPMSPMNESIWSDIQDRSAGDTVRKEDLITTNKDLRNKIIELYIEQGEGETLDVSSLANCIKCDDFSSIFSGLKEVKHIIGLEKWDVSSVGDMSNMFWGCNNFNCDLSNWNVSSVENMSNMFRNCRKFNSDLSKWDVSKVTNMYHMFEGCWIFNCDLSKWDVSSVEYMAKMFYNCKTFNSDLSKWNVSSVTDINSMFSGCLNFNSDLSKWNVSNVEYMEDMFDGCKNFNSDLSKWDVNSNITNIKDMFNGCDSLKNKPSWYKNQ